MGYATALPTAAGQISGGLVSVAVGTDPETYRWVPAGHAPSSQVFVINERLSALESGKQGVSSIQTTLTESTTITPAAGYEVVEYPVDASDGNKTITVADGDAGSTIVIRDEVGVCSASRTIAIAAKIEGDTTCVVYIDTSFGWARMTWKSDEYGYQLEHSH